MKIVDIPHMIPFEVKNASDRNKEGVMVYAGNFYKDIAKDVFDVLSESILSEEVSLQIFGRNDKNSLQEYMANEIAEKIEFGGFLDRRDILEKEKNADILLSIGCPGTDFISSKIFEYIAFGGKILHLYKGEKDPNYRYFDNYRNACCINLENSVDLNKKKIREEAAYSLVYMNNRNKPKKCLYTLDSFTNLKKRFFLSREFQDEKGWEWEQKIYNSCDLILNLKCHERHYSQVRYEKFRDC